MADLSDVRLRTGTDPGFLCDHFPEIWSRAGRRASQGSVSGRSPFRCRRRPSHCAGPGGASGCACMDGNAGGDPGLALLYLRFIYAGIPAAILYNTAAAVLRAVGDSRTPLRAMTVSSVCNIVLDLLFVLVLNMGIPGAAVSTVLAQLLSGICCLIGIRRIPGLSMRREDCRADRELIEQELRLGLPLCLQNMITSFGGLVVQSVINGFGVLFIAGYTAANKLYGLLEIAASSYGYAMSSYAGQNMGAGKRKRIGAGLRAANLIGTATAYLMSAVMILLENRSFPAF